MKLKYIQAIPNISRPSEYKNILNLIEDFYFTGWQYAQIIFEKNDPGNYLQTYITLFNRIKDSGYSKDIKVIRRGDKIYFERLTVPIKICNPS